MKNTKKTQKKEAPVASPNSRKAAPRKLKKKERDSLGFLASDKRLLGEAVAEGMRLTNDPSGFRQFALDANGQLWVNEEVVAELLISHSLIAKIKGPNVNIEVGLALDACELIMDQLKKAAVHRRRVVAEQPVPVSG